MANRRFNLSTPDAGVSIPSGTETPYMSITAPANQDVLIKGLSLGMSGVNPIDPPIYVSVAVASGTPAGSAGTPTIIGNTPGTVQTATHVGSITGLTKGASLWDGTVHPQLQGGFYLPLKDEIVVAQGTTAAVFFTNAGGSTNTLHATLTCEE